VRPGIYNIADRETLMKQEISEVHQALWNNYHYYDIRKATFNPNECNDIIELNRGNCPTQGKISGNEGRIKRDSDIFWVPRSTCTEWIFSRLWILVSSYNSNYGFDLSNDMGQAQLTRYRPGQHYEWHMDLGSNQPSLRKITAVVELSSKQSVKGGGLEIFYGQSIENKVDLDIGDVVLFPSFVMHRASMVDSGTRWSLVLWLTGTRPLR